MTIAAVAAVVLACVSGAHASVIIETVSVGNPGNAGELSGSGAGGWGPDRICGAVGYTYNIGKYEVTAGQYTEFLNAVAATDTYGLYNTDMLETYACKIQRSGTSGSYTYSVAQDRANRPVTHVSWGDSARFSNWLHNGQPTGAQGLGTTEDGSYFLNGATSDPALMAVTRSWNATWAIPTEDEWYKAAYHKNDGVTGNYFDYPTSSDSVPSNQLIDPDPGNNATYASSGYTIGSPYFRTEVGAHENSDSPYGTFDQGGNVWEWTEAVMPGSSRGLRGQSWSGEAYSMQASVRYYYYPTHEHNHFGFRVVIPEPATAVLFLLGGLFVARRRPVLLVKWYDVTKRLLERVDSFPKDQPARKCKTELLAPGSASLHQPGPLRSLGVSPGARSRKVAGPLPS